MRTAMEDLSPKSRRSVRQSLLFLTKRPSLAPIVAKNDDDDDDDDDNNNNTLNDEDDDDFEEPGGEDDSRSDVDQADESLFERSRDTCVEDSLKSISDNDSSATQLLKVRIAYMAVINDRQRELSYL